MRRKFPWVVLGVLALGLLVGCASSDMNTDTGVPDPWVVDDVEYPWPSIACPPGDPMWSARDRLNRIVLWAAFDGDFDTVVYAADCRDIHYPGPNHTGAEVDEMSQHVYDAWLIARKAFRTRNNPALKAKLWASCRNELDHDP